ncbi:MAG: FMN-binding negative transcriptional regulator [Bacteroidota bacterium]
MPYYTAADEEEIYDFMQQHSFVTLIGYDGEFPVATQVPVAVHREAGLTKLIGHVMTKTNHHEAFQRHPNVMAIFTGAHSYVSASVYENPKSASTWNYKTVQVKGKIRLLTKDETYQIIKDITDKYEKPDSSPAAFHKMDEDYIQKNLAAITGFEILVSNISHVFKMSQNHSIKNRENIIANLEHADDALSAEVAREMRKDL